MSDTTTPADPGLLRDYTVTMEARIERSVTIAAASPEEAIKLAVERREGLGPIVLRPVSVEDETDSSEVVGRCEACQAWLLDGDWGDNAVYAGDPDGDGVYLCHSCAAQSLKDAGADQEETADDTDATEATAPAGGEE